MGWAEGPGPRPAALVWAYAATDFRLLWRHRTPVVFLFLVPAMLSLILGPYVSGGAGLGAAGRSELGFAVMFSFMTTNYVGVALFREFVDNTWVLQAVHQPPRGIFLLGKALPVAAAGLLQLVVFGAAALWFLGLPLHGNIVQLLIVAVVLVTFASVLGVVLYNLTTLFSVFQSLAYLMLIALGGLGGAIVLPAATAGHLPPAEPTDSGLLGAARVAGGYRRRRLMAADDPGGRGHWGRRGGARCGRRQDA